MNRSLPGTVSRHSRFVNLLICLEYILSCAGPSTWHKECPIASTGERQSPIDLKPTEAKHDSRLKPVVVSYPPFTNAMYLNNGHSVVFQPSAGHQSGNKINTKACTGTCMTNNKQGELISVYLSRTCISHCNFKLRSQEILWEK